MRILLTGGAGLVGQNLIVRLKRRGLNQLVVLDKHPHNLAVLRQLHPDITVIEADLAQAGPWMAQFAGIDALVMLHAQIGAPDAAPFVQNNLLATERVLEAVKQHQVPYTVHISSSVVNSVADDHYTRTKRQQEQMVIDSGIAAVVLRPTLMFGWFDRKHLGWLSRFMQKVPVFPIPGHGRYMRQPLYVGDFCEVIIACLEHPQPGQRYNISGNEEVDYIDIIRQIKLAIRARTLILTIPFGLFAALLKTWALFDRDPPFTVEQLHALVAGDAFEVIDWPGIFKVRPTPFAQAVQETFNDPVYSKVVLEF